MAQCLHCPGRSPFCQLQKGIRCCFVVVGLRWLGERSDVGPVWRPRCRWDGAQSHLRRVVPLPLHCRWHSLQQGYTFRNFRCIFRGSYLTYQDLPFGYGAIYFDPSVYLVWNESSNANLCVYLMKETCLCIVCIYHPTPVDQRLEEPYFRVAFWVEFE